MNTLRSASWLVQAHHDVDTAQVLFKDNRYAWACYACQQAAEKAIKAVRIELGASVTADGMKIHSLSELAGDLHQLAPGAATITALAEALVLLGQQDQQSRYPGHRTNTDAAPAVTYKRKEAQEALKAAGMILAWADALTAQVADFWKSVRPKRA